MDAALRAGPLVFVDDIDAPVIDEGDWHHLTRVLRVRPGAAMCLSDGRGAWRTAALEREPADFGELHRSPPRPWDVAIGVAVPKGSRVDTVVQKLSELGVDRVVLLHTARSVVRWEGADAARRMERLRRVAREACMQARQLWLPSLEGPVAFGALSIAGSVALAEPGGGAPVPGTLVLVGPEGGWDAEELAAIEGRVGLGPSILRVETAAIALGAHLCTLRDAWWS
jgi:16S rRNA (uracil1498-N3)-methyltransferase